MSPEMTSGLASRICKIQTDKGVVHERASTRLDSRRVARHASTPCWPRPKVSTSWWW